MGKGGVDRAKKGKNDAQKKVGRLVARQQSFLPTLLCRNEAPIDGGFQTVDLLHPLASIQPPLLALTDKPHFKKSSFGPQSCLLPETQKIIIPACNEFKRLALAKFSVNVSSSIF